MRLPNRVTSGLVRRLLAQDEAGRHQKAVQAYLDRILLHNDDDMSRNGEAFFVRCLAKVLPTGIVLDVGANSGDWAKMALKASDDWSLQCFEPNAETFQRLQEASLPAARVTLHNFGLSNEAKDAHLYNYAVHDGMSSLYLRDSIPDHGCVNLDGTDSIHLDTLAHVSERLGIEEATLLKIDVEGHEKYVLDGAGSLLREHKVKAVQFEYGGTWIDSRSFLIDVWKMLAGSGYQMFKVAPNGLLRCHVYKPQLEVFQYCNYVALAPEVVWPRQWALHL